MPNLTVKALAAQLKIPVEEILDRMQSAGLSHTGGDEEVSAGDKKTLAQHIVKMRKAGTIAPPARASRQNTVTQGRRTVDVEVRKRSVARQAATVQPANEPLVDDLEEHRRQAAEEQKRNRENELRQQEESEKRQAVQQQEEKKEKKVRAGKKERKVDRSGQEQEELEPGKGQAAPSSARRKVEGRVGAKLPRRRRTGPLIGEDGRRNEKQRVVDQALNESTDEKGTALKAAGRRAVVGVLNAEGLIQKFVRPTKRIVREVVLEDKIAVVALARQMAIKVEALLQLAEKFGLSLEADATIDRDTAKVLAEELGHRAVAFSSPSAEHALQSAATAGGTPMPCAPVVTVMGHVDHGKTSLLDYIRRTKLTAKEAGGITQSIGAYRVRTEQGEITFIDTPGHAAFSAMRARGAECTDVVILVVAADDGVMPQTLEAIQHARAAEVPIVVALNKIDREDADTEKVRRELAAAEVVPENWGGDVQFVHVSALNGEGVDKLLEAVLLQAELLELRAPPDVPATGIVLESRLDKGLGPVASLLVRTGTLRTGDMLLAGDCYGRVRGMVDENGQNVKEAIPSMPIEVVGLRALPMAGAAFAVVQDEQKAREIAALYSSPSQEAATPSRPPPPVAESIEEAFSNFNEADVHKELNIVLKADTQGSVEALRTALSEVNIENAELRILLAGVGAITESDVNLAVSSKALVFGFNVRAETAARKLAEAEGVELRYYNVIYAMLEDTQQLLEGLLVPKAHENVVGIAEVLDVFRASGYGQAAGCIVREGTVHRNKPIRVLRDNIVIFEGVLDSLRRFKGDVTEVRSGTECGVGVKNYNDIKVGDQIEVFESAREVQSSRRA